MLSASRQTTIGRHGLLDMVDECALAGFYLGITKIPCLICSPFRIDKKPSLSIFTRDGKQVYYIDFGTGERGSLIDLLGQLWNLDNDGVIDRIYKDLHRSYDSIQVDLLNSNKPTYSRLSDTTARLECKIREWRDYDIEYWESYGVTLGWLQYADVYPISHKIIIKGNNRMVFPADKYAYTYVEFKEGKVTHKFYSPFNTEGFKWQNNHDRSVVSLWTKVPAKGDVICVCSSLKDALCLWSNIGIPSIAVQGEGYPLSQTAINELKRRFKRQYICLDNDEPGMRDAEKLTKLTGFTNVVIPQFEGGKDISDYFHLFGKQQFIQTFNELFKWKEQ